MVRADPLSFGDVLRRPCRLWLGPLNLAGRGAAAQRRNHLAARGLGRRVRNQHGGRRFGRRSELRRRDGRDWPLQAVLRREWRAGPRGLSRRPRPVTTPRASRSPKAARHLRGLRDLQDPQQRRLRAEEPLHLEPQARADVRQRRCRVDDLRLLSAARAVARHVQPGHGHERTGLQDLRGRQRQGRQHRLQRQRARHDVRENSGRRLDELQTVRPLEAIRRQRVRAAEDAAHRPRGRDAAAARTTRTSRTSAAARPFPADRRARAAPPTPLPPSATDASGQPRKDVLGSLTGKEISSDGSTGLTGTGGSGGSQMCIAIDDGGPSSCKDAATWKQYGSRSVRATEPHAHGSEVRDRVRRGLLDGLVRLLRRGGSRPVRSAACDSWVNPAARSASSAATRAGT